VVRLASEQALSLAPDGNADRERAHLFRGAARTLADDYEDGLAELKAIDASKLAERDSSLLNATLQLALDVRKPASGTPAGAETDNPPPTPARLDLSSSTTVLERAQKQLRELDLLTTDRRP